MSENYIERYKNFGWKLIALRGKIPIEKNWNNAIAYIPGFGYTPNEGVNIGIQTGKVSGIIVVDVDKFDNWFYNSHDPTFHTPIARTGKGLHYYFKYQEGIKNSVGKIADGVDVRSDNGYVVAPPSIHPDTGKPYSWSIAPWECPLAEFPKELMWKLEEPIIHSPKTYDIQMIGEGKRNAYLTSRAGIMRNKGFEYPVILAALKEENFMSCNPPLSEKEVESIAKSVSRYEPSGAQSMVDDQSHKLTDGGSIPPPATNIHKYSEIKKIDFPPVEVIPTGIKSLDQYLDGGLGLKELSLFVAEQETGKSTIACQIGANAVKNGYNVLHVFYEDELKSVKERYDGHNIDPEESLTDVFLLDATYHPATVESIEKKIKEINPGLVIVDYFARIPSSRGLNENRFELRDTMMKLGNLARQNNCHVMVLDHVTITFKDYSDSKEPWCYKMREYRLSEAKMFKLMVINLCIGMIKDKDEMTVWFTGMKNKRRARKLFKQLTVDWAKGVFNG